MAFKIIDAHMHLGPRPARMVPDQRVSSLIDLMDHLGIERCISAHRLSMMGQYEEGIAAERAASEACGGRIYSFCLYDTRTPEAAVQSILAHKDDPQCVGLKVLPINDNTHADSELYRPLWEAARKVDKAIMAHTWDVSTYNPLQVYAVAGKFEKWLAEYPDVNFVFGHCGGRYNGMKQAIELGKKYPNAYFDITGDLWQTGFLEELVDAVGADHVLYGSDYTMIDQRPMLGVVYGAALPNIDKEKILYHTAARIYFHEE